MIKSLLFDMDGILVDTEPIMARVVALALADQGLHVTELEYYDNWTKKGKGIADFIKEKNISFDFDRYRSTRNKIYLESLKTNIPIFDGAKETIAELSKTYKLGLVSSSSRVFVHFILKSTDLEKYFFTIITAEDVEKEKPAPDCFLLAAERLAVEPEECVVIEDAEKGILAAKNAGMKAIAIPNKSTSDNDFSCANLILESIKSLTHLKDSLETC
ncbi:MAG TPA: HAD family phosphatase [Candidatus Acidoferrum sp.]|jgi:HAD superfamily hydrolase (TIGR01509 family)|nr:HAD family phosphatase [Candidatus Acidoferrum sp.]